LLLARKLNFEGVGDRQMFRVEVLASQRLLRVVPALRFRSSVAVSPCSVAKVRKDLRSSVRIP